MYHDLVEYWSESENQDGCVGTEWLHMYHLFTLILWLSGGCGSLLLPSITKFIVLFITSPGKDEH